jgi:predicted DNA-binding WGR domain protein
MRRFELSEGTSNKFWEIEVDGSSVTTRWGRLGTNGQSKTKEFASAAKAQAEHDALVREKTGKGYSEVGVVAGAALPRATPAPKPAAPAAAPPPPPAAAPPAAPEAIAPPAADEAPVVVWTAAQRARAYPRRGSGVTLPKLNPAEAHAAVADDYRAHKEQWRRVREDAAPELHLLLDSVIERMEGGEALVCETPVIEGAVAAVLGQTQGNWQQQPPVIELVDLWVARAGLAFAVEALAEWMGYSIPIFWHQQPRVLVRVQLTHSDVITAFKAWLRLRTLLAGAAEADWQAAREVAARRRAGASLLARSALAFLFPEVPEWAEEDLRSALAASAIGQSTGALLSCARDGALMAALVRAGAAWSLIPCTTGYNGDLPRLLASMIDVAGPAAVEPLGELFDRAGATDQRRECAEALAMIRTPAAVKALVERLDRKETHAAATESLLSVPALALPALAAEVARGRSPQAEALLAMIARQHGASIGPLLPALPEASRRAVTALLDRLSGPTTEAAPDQVPPLLADPPWNRRTPRKAPAVLEPAPIPLPDAIVWSYPQEEKEWREAPSTPWFNAHPPESWLELALRNLELRDLVAELPGLTSDEALRARIAALAERSHVVQQGYCAIGSLWRLPARLALALWETLPPQCWSLGWDDPRPWLATMGLAGLPQLIVLAERQTAGVLPFLGPFRSTRLAPIVADAHARLTRGKAEAERWLLLHDEYAAVTLVPAALGRPGKARTAAEGALRLLVKRGRTETVKAAAARHGAAAAAAIDELLSSDGADLFPARLPRLPAFFQPGAFTRPLLAGGGAALPVPAVETLGTMLAISELSAPYPGLEQVKEACDRASLARFVWDLFSAWLIAGAPSKERWAFEALAHLGDDECARRLAALIREWPGEAAHARAVTGLDVLAALGTDVALMHLNGIAQKLKFKGLQDRAREKIGLIAEQRGLTAEELADRLVPDLGLDEDGSLTLEFGPRSFRVGFDEHLRPFVRDGAGNQLTDLPKPGKADQAEVAQAAVERWRALKKDVKTLAAQQILRLELAMSQRRRFDPEVFRTFLVEHPLVQHIARRLVWGVYDGAGALVGTFRVSEDRSLASVDDDPYQLPAGAQVGVVHALELPAELSARWGQVFGDYEILQPFRQLGREAFPITDPEREARSLERFAGTTVPTGKVLGLEARGWRRGAAQDGGGIWWFEKRIPATQHEAHLELDPGIIVGMVNENPEQKLGSVKIVRANTWHDTEPMPLGRLDPIVFSELVRDLEGLRS